MEKTFIARLGSIQNIPMGQGRSFIVEGEEVAVFRTRGGSLFAIENKCPHLKGPLSDGIVGDGKVVCPLHGHKFDLKTGEGSEGHECVNIFDVREENGNILLVYPSSLPAKDKTQERSFI